MRTALFATTLVALWAEALAFTGSQMGLLRKKGMPSLSSHLKAAPALRSSGRMRMALTMPAPGNLESLDGRLPDCPETKWSVENIDIAAEQERYRKEGIPESLIEIVATEADNAKGMAYFEENKEMILEKVKVNGSVILRGFDVSKDAEGFRKVWETLGMNPCLDPIHSSGLRSFFSAKDAVYEEVNKKSLAKHYIGLHNESTFRKTATYGAFVCFNPATQGGGEFFVADGAKIFRDLRTDILQDLYNRKVRISVSNLDLDFLAGLGPLKDPMMDAFKGLVGSAVAPKFDMDLDMIYGTDGRECRLQAIEHPQSPVNRHPETGRPLWFCNVHNHARYLRDRRPCTVPEVGMTDVYYGDLSHLPAEYLDHINEVSQKHIQPVAMKEGDVWIVDNYRMLHGRDVFEGDRLHAVSWFRKGDEPVEYKDAGMLNSVINKFIK